MPQQEAVIRLLLVEDRLEDAEQLISHLRNGGIAVRPTRAESPEQLAEVVGGAIAFNLLFGFPLLAGGMVMGLLSLLLLSLRDRSGAKAFERVIIALLLIIAIGFGRIDSRCYSYFSSNWLYRCGAVVVSNKSFFLAK